MNINTTFPKLAFYLCCAIIVSGCASAKYPPSDNRRLLTLFEDGGLNAEETQRGVVVYLPSVMFVLDSAKISEDSVGKLIFISEAANKDFIIDRSISIEGHTDHIGTNKYNEGLSQRRAEAVATDMIRYDVDSKRLDIKWYGETRPLLPNRFSDGRDNPEGRAANRRVEVIFLN